MTVTPRQDNDVLRVEHLYKSFDRRLRRGGPDRTIRWAVQDVTLGLGARETLGLAGESGSGKSTLARCILQLLRPTSGCVQLGDVDLTTLSGRALRHERSRIGIVFQDPYSSLNPRWTVEKIVRHPLEARHVGTRREQKSAAQALLTQVGVPSSYSTRLPGYLSGGERQRVAIARALVLQPTVLLCDEPTSSLDVSVQAQILNLLQEIQHARELAILFISHNMAVVRRMSDRVAIMRAGAVVEHGDVDKVFETPTHQYTRQLIAAIPSLPNRPSNSEESAT